MATIDTADESEIILDDLGITRGLTVQWLVVSWLGFIISFGLLTGLYQAVTGQMVSFSFVSVGIEWWNRALDLLVLAALTLVIVPPHEWLHGLAIRYYGGRPRYGVGVAYFVLPYGYATTDHRFTRDQFVVVSMTPLIVLSLIGVILLLVSGSAWLVVPLAANAGGAVGDLWMALTVLGYPKHIRVEDRATGLRILGRPGDRPRSLSVARLVWDTLVGTAAASAGIWVLCGFVAPMALLSLDVGSLTLGVPGTITLLFEYRNTPDAFSYSIGPGWLVAGGLIGLVYAFVRTRLRQRIPPKASEEG